MGSSADRRTARWRRHWDKQATTYDQQMSWWDRKLFRDSRPWVCTQSTGDVLEVAVGTGLNLPHYPASARLVGIDTSAEMLRLARSRAKDLGRDVDLRQGDAMQLETQDRSFDTVVCTFGLCAIPDDRRAIAEMVRVLRPGGLLLLADHIIGQSALARGVQRLAELCTVPTGGEHFRRRPLEAV